MQEGEAAGGGAGAGASGRDGGGDSGAQMAAGAVDVVEVRALREALRAAEEVVTLQRSCLLWRRHLNRTTVAHRGVLFVLLGLGAGCI